MKAEIRILPLGSIRTNCCVVFNEGEESCVVIDPGFEEDFILKVLKGLGLRCKAVLITHGHPDHIGALPRLVEEFGCGVYINAADGYRLQKGISYNAVSDGEVITEAGMDFKVVATPGHSEGSVCYILEDTMFSGDTLFYLSCGRDDFPGGNGEQLRQSLKKLAAIKYGDLFVIPGHGQTTTLAFERQHNPYLR